MKLFRHHYRLYVTRALSAAILMLIAMLLYAVGIALTNSMLGRHGQPPLITFVLLTLAVAFAIRRVRRDVDRNVGRLVLGQDADSYASVSTFVTRIANSLAVDDVVPRLAEAAARTMHSERAEVRLWLSDGKEWSQAWPPERVREVAPGIVVDVTLRGKELGEIDVEAPAGGVGADRSPLDEIARPAGLALSTVQLTLDLRRRAAEAELLNRRLRASRQRIIDARRVERDLVLADLGRTVDVQLRAADACLQQAINVLQRQTAFGPVVELGAELNSAGEAAREGLEALRRLARGVFPPVLAEYGAVAALEVWAKTLNPPARIDVRGDQTRLRSSPDAETALYFVCVAAITELSPLLQKSAQPSPLVQPAVQLVVEDDEVTMVVPAAGKLSRSLMELFVDRFEALGGTLRMRQDQGATRVLVGNLPLKGGVQ